MKIVKTASGTQVKLSKSDWESIGKNAGWMRTAQLDIGAAVQLCQEIEVTYHTIQSKLATLDADLFLELKQTIIKNIGTISNMVYDNRTSIHEFLWDDTKTQTDFIAENINRIYDRFQSGRIVSIASLCSGGVSATKQLKESIEAYGYK